MIEENNFFLGGLEVKSVRKGEQARNEIEKYADSKLWWESEEVPKRWEEYFEWV